ncbi:beach-domain-containing protein [Lentinus tigrinus ALCF2SS1-7]|uniref:Beach-domain-containing protein n=1 Tax=Lentinus tigrinus ALCF2SS1-6 TaxID=1328759 RepID=A0A5C2SQS9_9APHY|nr:beach-domain-containing protein [Lentinus tigrinus ALCF2SS1-6]RPD79172.1 beach-domain-containing protein [Lentinus tigrinus ALCF2SS1-7]
MLRTLLTPLSARFSLPSPLSPRQQAAEVLSDPDDLDPEDFARDVLVELMRNATERLKTADTLSERIEVLTEIHKIMLQDACTKDVFREMDGFLVLMSVLSTIHPTFSQETQNEAAGSELLEATRLVFLILSEALHKHNENVEYFKTTVGLESFSQATLALVTDSRTVKQTMSFLTCLALHNFAWSRFFLHMTGADHATMDKKFQDFSQHLGLIHVPEALQVLYNAATLPGRDDPVLRYMGTKLLERLALHKHRNQCVLSSLGFIRSLFERLCCGTVLPKPERQVVQKLLKRLLDHHVETADARLMFQRAIRKDDTLDPDVLEVLRAGMKVKWPEHFSFESPAAIRVTRNGTRALPSTGFTFMVWLWIEQVPRDRTHNLFSICTGERDIFSLKLRPDGNLDCESTGSKDPSMLKARLAKGRWTHVTLVHYPYRGSKPTIRLFIDGMMVDSLQWQYPRGDANVDRPYIVGDSSTGAVLNWCMASAYLLSQPLPDELPRIIHDLGPRYVSRFQAADLIRFLTYEAATALNIHLFARAEQARGSAAEVKGLINSFKNGLGISESSIIFAISTVTTLFENKETGELNDAAMDSDVFLARCNGLDLAMWEIGGAAVALRLVQLAQNAHEVSRALGVLTDGLRNSWQNSEDMEQLRGYDILADILRKKCHLINMTGFETLFEFLGMNFRSPDHSTIVNTVAYRAIALDFQLWCRTRREIQLVHIEHFATLLDTSRHKRFNIKQRLSKMGVVRKLLFALQTDWYPNDLFPFLLDTLKVVAEANFSIDDAIRPIVSYLAANLHDTSGNGASSPRSIISRIDHQNAQYKAEQVFKMFVSVLDNPAMFNKFTATLPLTRICLLLLGDRPSPLVATLVLRMISTALGISTSFSRKFELVSGWNVLKLFLPYAWDVTVQDAAFDVLLGRSRDKRDIIPTVVCPHIVPAIFASLKMGLDNSRVSDDPQTRATASANVEHLLETLIDTHSTSPTFREVFRSHAVTQSYIDAYKMYSTSVAYSPEIDQSTIRVLEKLSHLGLSIALDNAVAVSQKQEIMDVLQAAESVLNPRATQETSLDPAAVVGTKARRRRMASVRLSMQLGESAVKRSIIRIHEWRKSVVITERKRLRKTVLDLREHNRQIASLTEWSIVLTTERGLWAKTDAVPRWRLDETEGPYRVRKKLEHDEEKMPSSKVDQQQIGDVQSLDVDTQSIMQIEVPPWSESYDLSSTEVDDQLGEEIVDDKHRRVRHELEPGDIIDAVKTVARISGVDSSPGLLIFGRSHLYLLDGLVENDDGEVIEAHDAPRKLFFVPGSIMDLDHHQRAQRWPHDQIMNFSDRTFLFRDVALEIYFRDSRSLLVVFVDRKQRREITSRLSHIIGRIAGDPGSAGLLKSPFTGKLSAKVSSSFGARMLSGFSSDELSIAQRKWQSREISNFTYLSILNQVSGRTPSDATQYPVFPWVLSDYTSSKLDLSKAETFRDLSLPMGALTEARREAARSRYDNLQSVGEKPFHYGTHFSSSMIVCHFLIRMEPFTHMFKTLQGGDWDLPDRLFIDINRAYSSASQDIRGDVRELIPEFFSCPEFLENSQNLDFGVQQSSGEKIHDVKLPPWARNDPLLFVVLNRKALESDYVSEHLPQWIDLIWGCKQGDPDSYNVFHPLSYEGAIDLDAITDDLEREATVGIIHNFGQTPRKIFGHPHPSRHMHGNSALPLGIIYGIAEDYHLLTQGSRPLKDLGSEQPVRELVLDLIGQQVIPCPEGMICVPSRPHEGIVWEGGPASTGSLKVMVDRKVSQVVESAFCSCATFADAGTLVTGSTDNTVRLWRVIRNDRSRDQPVSLQLTHLMRGHTARVNCIAASRAWSLIVSGSKDGSAAIWDLNRGVYTCSIWHGSGPSAEIHLVSIYESTGYIATCSRDRLWLHTINARPIVSLDLTEAAPSPLYPPVTSIAFLERDYSHTELIATGAPDGTITLRTWNANNTPEGEKAQWEFVTLKTLKVKSESRFRSSIPCVTALKFVGESLYHGEDTGKLYGWELPD